MPKIENLPFFDKFNNVTSIREYDFDHGEPGLVWGQSDGHGHGVLIKYWLDREKDKTKILEEMWLYEIRQLHRLKGCRGIGDYTSLGKKKEKRRKKVDRHL